ncbi:acyl-CoA thioesterase [Dethiosulfovibrio sp. F2B]|uniref:acyl-CoA thioesterase n=1 Tax=Dethiosulfovibrio faecalis TaxID=2720018 RepID=UPI001F1CDF2C|nr:thioesterase family protein [Dethiosulfovibrio faecalis]MCF4150584.1 acyl-CoA thioesterase [Dethiosulfovibrio faecalis]
MRESVFVFRVRYAETDQMGIAHHGNYLTWFEMGRSNLCREWGKPYASWEDEGVFLPVVEASCRYKSPARYDEELSLRTSVEQVKPHSVTFKYRLYRGDKLLAEGKTRHAFATPDGKLIRGGHPLIRWLEERSTEGP